MPVWLEWIFYILIVVVMLGVLIAIHEAGHLATAKLFRVYCFEYSIGMGPKIFSKKRKGGETTFSIRAVPFGGYVAMYGEQGAVPDGEVEPPAERSLNNIAKWKKAIILVAGVTLNFILGLTLIYIGDQACPIYYSGRRGATNESGTMLTVSLDTTYDQTVLDYIGAHKVKPDHEAKDYVLTMPSYNSPVPGQEGVYENMQLLAFDVRIYTDKECTTTLNDTYYVAVYTPSTVVERHGLGDSLMLFPSSKEEVPESLKILGVSALPQVYDENKQLNNFDFSHSKDGISINLPVSLIHKTNAREIENYASNLVHLNDLKLSVSGGKLTGGGVNVETIKEWNSFPEAWKQWAEDVPMACGAIVKGFATLFTPDGWRNISGIIGITAAMPQINAAGGARMIFFYAGMISINLAFFNLLPFPGLDGWALLVTAIEGISRKKVPARVQGIVSTVGLVLLIGLMVLIAVKDVAALF
ncbi:MAG: site-2 protease family protein [Bacilli bacterium]|nr:site-2 protease family protein [Bacilli bacterium]